MGNAPGELLERETRRALLREEESSNITSLLLQEASNMIIFSSTDFFFRPQPIGCGILISYMEMRTSTKGRMERGAAPRRKSSDRARW